MSHQYEDMIIGIDLGTTYSCASVFRNGRSEIIPTKEGDRTMPSYVSVIGGKIVVGKHAKQQASRFPKNTFFDSKRMIGRAYDDAEVQTNLEHWPFDVARDENNRPVFHADGISFTPEQISAEILKSIRLAAEAYLGQPIREAVITCPAHMSNEGRVCTKTAAGIAGLEVKRMINEPTASALAYGLHEGIDDKYILVFDFGGGTLDITIVYIQDGVFEVKSTAGNMHCGGQDIDNRLCEHFAREFSKQTRLDVFDDPRALRKLLSAAEDAKRALTSAESTEIFVESLLGGHDYQRTLSRAEMSGWVSDIIEMAMKPIKQALDDSQLTTRDIDQVVLIGGSSRIPIVQQRLHQLFPGKPLCNSISPDEGVAIGAGIQGHLLSAGPKHATVKDVLLLDICPLSLGCEVKNGEMDVLIKRNTTIPTEVENEYVTNEDFQSEVRVKIYEGERFLVRDNNLLGDFLISNIPPKTVGQVRIFVKFSIDENGIMNVEAKTNTSQGGKLTIQSSQRRVAQSDVLKAVEEAERNKSTDSQNRARVAARSKLEDYLREMINVLKSPSGTDGMESSSVQAIERACQKVGQWLKSTESQDLTPVEYERMQTQLEKSYTDARK